MLRRNGPFGPLVLGRDHVGAFGRVAMKALRGATRLSFLASDFLGYGGALNLASCGP